MKSVIYIGLLLVLSSSCAFVPINNQFDRAATLKKGNFEVAGGFTGNSASGGGENQHVNNNAGARIGYGISDRFDLKLRYERLFAPKSIDRELRGSDYFSIIPKFALVRDKFSLLIPLSRYNVSTVLDDEEKQTMYSIAPQILYTWTNKARKADLTMGVKGDFIFGDDGGGLLMGATIGGGFSSNLDKWAIRPELGAFFIGEGVLLSYGVGLQIIIPGKYTSR